MFVDATPILFLMSVRSADSPDGTDGSYKWQRFVDPILAYERASNRQVFTVAIRLKQGFLLGHFR